MKLRKFKAASMREALARVKEELGSDALIISTKPARGPGGTRMLEVTAAIDEEGPQDAEESPPTRERAATATAPPVPPADLDLDQIMLPLRSELRALRSLVKNSRPKKSADHSALIQEVADLKQMVAAMSRRAGPDRVALEEVAEGRLLAKPSEARVLAIVGPTGVGKTTTIAKLAADAALMQRRRVHILSLDTHRVGATAQIRSFGKMMGVPVTIVSHVPTELAPALEAARDADLVLVDTAGRSLRDLRGPRRLEAQLSGLPNPEVHLALAAGTNAFDIDTIVARYAPLGVSRILFTKADETADLRELVLTPARHGIPVSYVSNGQKVPEDIQVATRKFLISMATDGQDFMEVA